MKVKTVDDARRLAQRLSGTLRNVAGAELSSPSAEMKSQEAAKRDPVEIIAEAMGATIDRLDRALSVQGAMLVKIADATQRQANPLPVSVSIKPNRPPSLAVKIVRDHNDTMTGLIITPIQTDRSH